MVLLTRSEKNITGSEVNSTDIYNSDTCLRCKYVVEKILACCVKPTPDGINI